MKEREYGAKRDKAYKILSGKPEGKIPLGIPRRRWEDNIKIDVRMILLEGADRIRINQDRSLSRPL
jgi:hypothetical protein